MRAWQLLWLGTVASASTACGGKVVFVETDGDDPPTGGAPATLGCPELCAIESSCPALVASTCLEWCNERVETAGKCLPELQAVMACTSSHPFEDCSADGPCKSSLAAYRICIFGCDAVPSCTDGPNETICGQTCERDFQWTCTQGLPEACTCIIDGQVVDTCTLSFSPSFAACCDGAFAENR